MRAVYIAAPYPMLREAYQLRTTLRGLGVACTSNWLDEVKLQDTPEAALMDLDDVERADALVLLNTHEYKNMGTGGRHVEFGYALARKKQMIVFGCASNVFHRHPGVDVVTEIADILILLR